MIGPQLISVFVEVVTLQGRRAIPLDEQQPYPWRQLCLGLEESIEHSFPKVGKGAGGVLPLPLVDQQGTVSSHIHEPFTALLNRHRCDLRVGHQNDPSHDAIISRACVVAASFGFPLSGEHRIDNNSLRTVRNLSSVVHVAVTLPDGRDLLMPLHPARDPNVEGRSRTVVCRADAQVGHPGRPVRLVHWGTTT
ncbi:hypothetical protein BIV24_24055 [Streptomyces colonosanans]|uniref:Uncharacterized protein n=1 Tax=Streptomyces colonosanans TaxID=1428652 RepID=A0A1S2P2K7_9ACTN|nr:hypothetical protein BIV24_24055 [Streptomyces colonosanans]